MRVVAWCVLSCVLAGACARGTPSGPSQVTAFLAGVWSGGAADSSGPGTMTWTVSQQEGAVSGTVVVVDSTTGVTGRGTLSGAVTGLDFTFTLRVPAGGFDAPYESCGTEVSGTGKVVLDSIEATYEGTSTCAGPIASGRLNLKRP